MYSPSIPDLSPSVVRVTWWPWGLIKDMFRYGMRQQGRSCLYLKGTQLEWVSREVFLRFSSSSLLTNCICSLKFLHSISLSGALAWNADQLSSGSRDRVILQRDIRAPPLQSERRLQGHRQEVCGLKWSTDHQLLASGGNDNKVRSCGVPTLCLPLLSSNTSVSPLFASPPVPTCCPAVAACVEPLKCPPSAAVHRALSRRESHRLVPTPARAAGLRRGHCRPLHPLLEHTDRPAPAVHRHWVAGLQPGLVQAH